ncbi:helicase, partial [Oryctes borbonicus]
MKVKNKTNDDVTKAKHFTKVIQPTFKFSWDNNRQNPIQSKIFKRKNVSNESGIENIALIKEKDDSKAVPSNDKARLRNPSESNNKKHVKRKKRKDKLLAKQFLKEGIEANFVKPINDIQKNNVPLFTETPRELYVNTSRRKPVSENVFAISNNKFSDLNIHRHLVSNLEKINYKTITNVQEKAIPIILTGKNCLIRSQTGSGKTLAYAAPIVNALQDILPKIKRTDGVQALIVVPTRELALQTHELFSKINTFQWIVTGHLCGGENRKSEKDRLRKGVSILIGTPGRLLDHALHTSCFNLSKIRCLVLDEADRLLDMGFRKDIMSLVDHIDKAKSHSEYDPMAIIKNQVSTSDSKLLKSSEKKEDSISMLTNLHSRERQTILLSATLNKQVSELADFTMTEHVYIDALEDDNGPSTSSMVEGENFVIPITVKQEFLITFVKHRLFTLTALIVDKCKQNSKLFIFMASSHMVEFHYELFTKYLQRMPKNRSVVKTGDYKGDKVVEFEDDEPEDD